MLRTGEKGGGTYRGINAREDEVHLSGIEAVGVGVHAGVVVDILALSSLVERDEQGNAGLEVRDVEGGVDGVLEIFDIINPELSVHIALQKERK